MRNRATIDKEIRRLERVARIEGTAERMNERLGTIENRIGSIETRMDVLSVVSLCATGGQIVHKNFSLTV